MDTIDQSNYIKEKAMTTPLKRIAKEIGRSATFVKSEMIRQGIVVPKEIREQFRSNSYFKKGKKPWNKGKPINEWMSEEAIEKSKKNRFKKGEIPHNTKSDFETSIRTDNKGYRYYHIRVKKSKWLLYHRWLWSQINGEIPPGHNIQFIDGNTLNCTIDNLYMTNRKNQLIINKRGGNKIPHYLKKTILLITQLNKQINEKQNY